MPQLDAKDELIIAKREARLNRDPEPRCGDYVIFADDIERRISHVFDKSWEDMAGVQTTDGKFGASFYLGDGYVEFSGGLYPMVRMETLTLTRHTKPGIIWIFHHDFHTAGWAVHSEIQFRVYLCSVNAPK
jgi:hypothetical protein